MKALTVFILLFAATKLNAAEILKMLECHDEVVHEGVRKLGTPKEIEALFGTTNVDHFISNFGSKAPPSTWNTVAYFFGRYRLSFKAPISIDDDNCTLNSQLREGVIQINETISIDISKSGIAGAAMKGQWRLGENDWKRLVTAKGDWSVVGIPILTNAPVKGFDEYVRQARAPILNRKEGFDNPIRQTLENLKKPMIVKAPNSGVDGEVTRMDCYSRIVHQGVEKLIVPKEVESLFGAGNVEHFISEFGQKAKPMWNSLTYFGGRYELSLQVPLAIDYDQCKLFGATTSAMVQIREIIKVKYSKPGIAEAIIKGHWQLNENEWKWLVKNMGDWSVVKVPILTNAPVWGFDTYARQRRESARARRQPLH